MDSNKIFVGDIKRCTKYDNIVLISSVLSIEDAPISIEKIGYIDINAEPYIDNAILLKIKDGRYVDINRLNTIKDYLRMYYEYLSKYIYHNGILMPTRPMAKGTLFVDEASLKPYYADEKRNVSIRSLKREIK